MSQPKSHSKHKTPKPPSNLSSTTSVKSAKQTPSNFANNNIVLKPPRPPGTAGSGSSRPNSGAAQKGVQVDKGSRPLSGGKMTSTSASQTANSKSTKAEGKHSSTSVKSSASSKSKGSGKSVTVTTTNLTFNKSSNDVRNNNVKTSNTVNPLVRGPSTVGTTAASGAPSIYSVKSNAKPPYPTPIINRRNMSNIFRSAVHLELSRNFRNFIERAMNQNKIFSGVGMYPQIRNALKHRGWVEKPGPLVYSHNSKSTTDNRLKAIREDESDTAWLTRVLKDFPPNFIWVNARAGINWKYLTRDQMINRFPNAWFTTKTGLAACLQQMHWFSEAGIADTFFPRCYRLSLEEERQAFQDDYRLTACMSLLRHFINTFNSKGFAGVIDIHSKVTPLSIDFACRQLGTYIRTRRHEDIDWLLTPNFMNQHWDAFLHQFYLIVHEGKKFRFDGKEAVRLKYEAARTILKKIAPFWPQSQLDGVNNMWICKPAAKSCGYGIMIKNTLDEIMRLVTQGNMRESNWVVQKYIERPLLIHKVKFDIRQWFLLTNWSPLTVWFYRDSYVRFCSKPFTLVNYHESIHLCNNAVQCRYQNAPNRDPSLPHDNMWSSEKFQWYLKTIGRSDAWPLIYSGMKQAIVGVLLASQETADTRKCCHCYELFGADFMLTEDFKPWLIEINDRPALDPTTSVTQKLCHQVLEDIVKVVVDKRWNRKAATGGFELIYRQNSTAFNGYEFNGDNITVYGRRLTRDVDFPMALSRPSVQNRTRNSSQNPLAKASSKSIGGNSVNANVGSSKTIPVTPTYTSMNNRATLSDHLQRLRNQNQELYQKKEASQPSTSK